VNETFARKYFAGERVVGHFLDTGARKPIATEIVGIVRDVTHMGVKEPVWPVVYLPALQLNGLEGTLLVRAGLNPTQLTDAVGTELRHVAG